MTPIAMPIICWYCSSLNEKISYLGRIFIRCVINPDGICWLFFHSMILQAQYAIFIWNVLICSKHICYTTRIASWVNLGPEFISSIFLRKSPKILNGGKFFNSVDLLTMDCEGHPIHLTLGHNKSRKCDSVVRCDFNIWSSIQHSVMCCS